MFMLGKVYNCDESIGAACDFHNFSEGNSFDKFKRLEE